MAIREKVAFVHYQKAVGVTINLYLIRQVFDADSEDLAQQGWKAYNSWRPPFSLARDWTPEELLEIAAGRSEHQQFSDEQRRQHESAWQHGLLQRQYVHNHHSNWSMETIKAFKENGWFTFTFLRDPAEILCSTYFWARDKIAGGTPAERVFRPPQLLDLPLDQFIRVILGDWRKSQIHRIALPDYIGELDFVAEFTESNFAYFLNRFFDHELDLPEKRFNHSSNLGYQSYRESGDISDLTHTLLETDPVVKEARRMMGPV